MDLLRETEIPYDKNKKIVWRIKMTPEEKAAADEEVRKRQEQKDFEWYESPEDKIKRLGLEDYVKLASKKVK